MQLTNSRNRQVLTSCQGPGSGPGTQEEEAELHVGFCHQGTCGLVRAVGLLISNHSIRPK